MMWLYVDRGQQQVSVEEDQLGALIQSGAIWGQTMVWNETMADWQSAQAIWPDSFPVASPLNRLVIPAAQSLARPVIPTKKSSGISYPVLGIGLSAIVVIVLLIAILNRPDKQPTQEASNAAILERIRGSWGMSKAAYLALIDNSRPDMSKKEAAVAADVLSDKIVFEIIGGKVYTYTPDETTEVNIEILSADGTTGQFVFKDVNEDGFNEEMKGYIDGDKLKLGLLDLDRINAEESVRRKEAIKNFDPSTFPSTFPFQQRDARIREMEQLIGLGNGLRVWSLDQNGAYPASLDDPSFLEMMSSSEKPKLFEMKNWKTGKVAGPWYVTGHSAESPAHEILLASPWVYDGLRVVIRGDTSGVVMKESVFQEELAKIQESGRELVK